MQTSVETISTLERRVTVGVEAEHIQKQITTRLNEIARTARLDGFRPGKIPFAVVDKRFRKNVHHEVISNLIDTSFRDALQSEKIEKIVGQPHIDLVKDGEDETGLEYTATFELFPDIADLVVDGLVLRKPNVDITDAEVDQEIERLRERNANWEIVTVAAKKGDRVLVDVVASVDNAGQLDVLEDTRMDNLPIIIGQGEMVDGVEDQLIGVKADMDHQIKVTFPNDYVHPKLAGQLVTLAMKIRTVEKPVLPALDVEFFKKLHLPEEGGLDALKERMKEALIKRATDLKSRFMQKDLMDKMHDKFAITFELPKKLVNAQLEMLKSRFRSLVKQSVGDAAGDTVPDSVVTDLQKQATRQVATRLLIEKYAKQIDMTINEDEMRRRIFSMAMNSNDPRKMVDQITKEPTVMAELAYETLQEQVGQQLISTLPSEEFTTTLEDLGKME